MTGTTKSNRPEKKSETIEVRVSYTEKLAFMDACKQAGITASQAIRGYISDFQNPDAARRKKARNRALVGAFVAFAALSGSYLWWSGANRPITPGERVVRYFDADGNGILNASDTETLDQTTADTIDWLIKTVDTDGSASVDANEIDDITNITLEFRGQHDIGNEDSDERVLIVPPGMSEAERSEFLKQTAIDRHIAPDDMARLTRMIEALLADGQKPAG